MSTSDLTVAVDAHRRLDIGQSFSQKARELFAPYLPCDDTTLRRVYLRLALKHHPDKVAEVDRADATQLFQAIANVYEDLTHPGPKIAKRVKSPTAAAAELGDVDELRLLLEEIPSRATELDDVGMCPLMFAARGGCIAAAELLLKYGADLHAQTPLGWSAVVFAGMSNQPAMVRWLVQQGAEVSDHDLILVAFTGNATCLKELLHSFAGSVASLRTDTSGKTLLHIVCEGMCHLGGDSSDRYTVCVDLLLQRGVPIDDVEPRKARTCLQNYVGSHLWLEENLENSAPHVKFVEELCLRGASPTRIDAGGSSALSLAVASGLEQVQRVLDCYSDVTNQSASKL